MDQIAAAVGVSKLTIYRRFPNKEALLIAVVDHYIGQLTATIDAACRYGLSALDELRETTRTLFNASLEQESILFGRLLIGESIHNETLSLRFGDWEATARAPVLARMVTAQQAGEVIDGDPGLLTSILCELVDGLARRRRQGLKDALSADPETFFEERWNFFQTTASTSSLWRLGSVDPHVARLS
ncbi:TetR/AcrR family transcriptional regulator [Sphingomonas qilianensis]|uniref:TetR/AcrR family transcriptional regulator n=1 Tax=Sphingomonas qilianensis TaxID=1736690 RepID=A0ABU9XW81_9SPHN